MYEALNKQLMEAKEKLREYQKTQARFSSTEKDFRDEKERVRKLQVILSQEELDVKKLESLSITGIFYSVLGSKERQLEKERQDFLAAKLKYDESIKALQLLEKELSQLRDFLTQHKNIEREYEELLKRKEEKILHGDNENAKKLTVLSEQLSDINADIKEINEAISAGKSLESVLSAMSKKLSSASNWGTWDMLGGGLLATAAKHSRIDEAKDYAHQAQILLQRFRAELQDVKLNTDLQVNIGGMDTFIDFFFDGLISDWIVQSKINHSLDNVMNVQRQTTTIINGLENKVKLANNNKDQLEKEIKELIEKL